MKKIATLLLYCVMACLTATAAPSHGKSQNQDFVTVKGIHFYEGKNATQPYYFIGTNLWYAPILGSEGQGGNRRRLCMELDSLHRLGVNNLRILVGADGGSRNANTVRPYLQPSPGTLNDTLCAGLDYMLAEMGRRGMKAVIYLTNSWDWSGGYGFYLRATGHGDSPNSQGEGYNEYTRYAAQFYTDEAAKQLFYNHVRRIVTRVNSLTGRPYRDDPTIMSWQLCNEPRPFSSTLGDAMLRWMAESAKLIKSLDPNHLVSTGSEGIIGCNVDEALCIQAHELSDIDYMTVHIWPLNWGWASRDRLFDALPNVYQKTQNYIDAHERIARKIEKPFVIEEFGYARDNNFHGAGTPTEARDAFYKYVFDAVQLSRESGGALAGCNFWGWGGAGRPSDEVWHVGADYLCDPPHEPQGWYSVFNNDSSTLGIIRDATRRLASPMH